MPIHLSHCTNTAGVVHSFSCTNLALVTLPCRPMDSDDESSWHSGMAILEQRSAHRSAGLSENTEVPATPTLQPRTRKHKSARKSRTSKSSKRKHKSKKRGKHQKQTEAYRSKTPSSSSNESASNDLDRPPHVQQLHTSVSDTQAPATTTSARTGETLRSRACAKMLVRAGHRCPCHFLRECPSVLFMQPVTLLFHAATANDNDA